MLTLADMPGPTDEARELQLQQYAAMRSRNDAYWAARDVTPDHETAVREPAYVQSSDAYRATVTKLAALLGPDAHCNTVDSDLFSLYSDIYKDNCNIRPRHHVTVADVQSYLDRH